MSTKDKNSPPKLSEWIMKKLFPDRKEYSTLGDLAEVYSDIVESEGRLKANWWYRREVFKSINPKLNSKISGGGSMFCNYMKIGIRNLRTRKLFSAINIFGLAIGLAVCLLISFWVSRELSYDTFHSKADRIYRVERELLRDEAYSRWPITGGLYRDALVQEIPEITEATRFWRRVFNIKNHKNNVHIQQIFATDNSVFNIFDFTLEAGDPLNALSEPRSLVLTKDAAIKYFGTTDVIGQLMPLNIDDEEVEFKITGLLADIPRNSHIKFDMLMSFSTYPTEHFSNWRSNYLYTYVLLKHGSDPSLVEEKLKSFVELNLEANYGDLLVNNYSIHQVLKMHLFPITEIHLNPSVNWELEAGGNKSLVILFVTIAIFILLIAGINFTNLSTARANRRAKEVSLRKTVGALSSQLKTQFIQESILISFVSLLISLLFLAFLIPMYNSIFDETLTYFSLLSFNNILLLVVMTLSIGIISGLYPAFYLTRFEPANVLKGDITKGKRRNSFRRNLVIIQFCISSFLIIGTSTVYMQMKYIDNKSIGFDKNNVITISARSENVISKFETFKDMLLQNSSIISVAASADLPGEDFYSNGNVRIKSDPDQKASLIFMFCNHDFINTMKMNVSAGRNFSNEFISDTNGVVLNESAAKRFGWTADEAIGKKLEFGDPLQEINIIGVIRDFNFRSLKSIVEPMMFILAPDYISSITVRTSNKNIDHAIQSIEKYWKEIFPNEQFNYSFLDQQIEHLYTNEKKMQNLLIVFAFFSLIIACLGLLGLSAFTVEEKTKEIGIRKTLGASVLSIVLLLVKDYLRWNIISSLITFPIAHYLMGEWLQNFAYHIPISLSPFALSFVISIVIALITVSSQVLIAALANPILSLKYE